MRRVIYATVTMIAVFSLISCGAAFDGNTARTGLTNDNSTTTTSSSLVAVPKSLSVDVPSSLLQSGTAARNSGGGGRYRMGGRDFSPGMAGHYWIKSGLWETQKNLARGAWTLVILDKAIADGALEPSEATVTGSSITWTQAMVDSYTAFLPSSFASSAAFKAVAPLPTVGSGSKLPDFVYSLVPSTDTENAATYSKMVSIAETRDLGSRTLGDTRTFYWSADRSKVKFLRQVAESGTTVEQTWISYDSTAAIMAAGRVDAQVTMTLEIKADSAATATHGTYLTYDASIAGGDADCPLALDGSVVIASEGYADDEGGTVTDTITVSSGTVVKVYYVKEEFGADGALASATYSTDGTTWTALMTATADTPAFYWNKLYFKMEGMGGMGGKINHDMVRHSGVSASGNHLCLVSNAGITVLGVWIAASDELFATVIGAGVARESGEARFTFTTTPVAGATYYIAPLAATGAVDSSKKIQLSFGS